jgi:hypothetical protein
MKTPTQLVKPDSRSFESALHLFCAELEEEPWRWHSGTLDEPVRMAISRQVARHTLSLTNRIKLLHLTAAKGGKRPSPVYYYRLKLTWIDFQALIKGLLLTTRETFTMKHFESVVTSWVMQEVNGTDGDKFESWTKQGGIYGPGSELGNWFASEPRKYQVAFFRKLLLEMTIGSEKDLHGSGDYFDFISRVKLVYQLVRAMRAHEKGLEEKVSNLHWELLSSLEDSEMPLLNAAKLKERVMPVFNRLMTALQ